MSIRSYLSIFFLLTFSLVKSQSFEKVSLVNKKMESYPFNESNAYLSDDGNTLFSRHGLNIRPVSGRVLVFPPTWDYPHSGLAPKSNPKYIMSTYIHYGKN